MHREQRTLGSDHRLVMVDSITQLVDQDLGAWVICGSHGGSSAAEVALKVAPSLVCLNDAGVGKDSAGILALMRLQSQGLAALTVAHTSARIGDSRDAWDNGIISHLNPMGLSWGFESGERLQPALLRIAASRA